MANTSPTAAPSGFAKTAGKTFEKVWNGLGKQVSEGAGSLTSSFFNHEPVQEAASGFAADIITKEIKDGTEAIKEQTATLTALAAQELDPEQKDLWHNIKAKLAPEKDFEGNPLGYLFRTLFARLVWVGARISSFVGALFIDHWTGRKEVDQNHPNITRIISGLFGKFLGDEDEETKLRKEKESPLPA